MSKTEELIERILTHPESCESNGAANELLREYFRGSPIDSLRRLLQSEDDRIAGEAAWIASELPVAGRPLLQEIADLLKHRSKKVRFWALDCVMLWSEPDDGTLIPQVVSMLEDTEGAVRWKAMVFLTLAPLSQLRSGLDHIVAADRKDPLEAELLWLLGPGGNDAIQIEGGLTGNDILHRRFAAVAAFRAKGKDSSLMQVAVGSLDPEISRFAQGMVDRIEEG